MIESLKSIYWNLQPIHLKELLIGTKARENDWAKRDFHTKNDWCGTDHSHRDLLCQTILKYKPYNVLEIGCNEGQNIFRLSKFIEGRAWGIDINKTAIENALKIKSDNEDDNVVFFNLSADQLHGFVDKSIDVVFTDATLIYIGKDKIDKVISEMVRIANKSIVLCEWQDDGGKSKYFRGCWVHDYRELFMSYHFEDLKSLKVTKITKEIWNDKLWSSVGAIIEVEL